MGLGSQEGVWALWGCAPGACREEKQDRLCKVLSGFRGLEQEQQADPEGTAVSQTKWVLPVVLSCFGAQQGGSRKSENPKPHCISNDVM